MSDAAMRMFCLVDIVNSTEHMHSGLGQSAHANQIGQSVDEFKAMLGAHGGQYENFTGDGNLASFSDPSKAFVFAKTYSRIQESAIYKNRVVLTAGTATYRDGLLVSDEVNFATRLNGLGSPGSLVLSQAAYDFLVKLDTRIALGIKQKTSNVRNYGDIQYYEYSVSPEAEQGRPFTEISIDKLKEDFASTGIYPVNILDGDYRASNTLIWPVVPRSSLNLIHIGQISAMKYLSTNLGWKLKILIADLMDDFPSVRDDYTARMNLYFKNKKIAAEEIIYLSELMKEETKTCCKITKETFYSYLKMITFEEMGKFIGKDYNTPDYKKKSVWKTLRPFFTLAAAAYLSSTLDRKCIILAGYDEHAMWNACTSQPPYERNLGAILVPILKKNDDSQFSHEDKGFYWRSVDAIKNAMRDSNIAKWSNDLLLKIHNDPRKNNDTWDDIKTTQVADIILEHLNLQHE